MGHSPPSAPQKQPVVPDFDLLNDHKTKSNGSDWPQKEEANLMPSFENNGF